MAPISEWLLGLCALVFIYWLFKAGPAISALKEGKTVSNRPSEWSWTTWAIYNHLKKSRSWMSVIRKEMPFGMALMRLVFLARVIMFSLHIAGRYVSFLPASHNVSPILYSLESVANIIAFISINKRYKWGWGLITISEAYHVILSASFHLSASDSVLPSIEGSLVHFLVSTLMSMMIVVYTVRNRSYFDGGE